MDTLSNVYSREGGSLLSSARLTPRTISSQDKTRVSCVWLTITSKWPRTGWQRLASTPISPCIMPKRRLLVRRNACKSRSSPISSSSRLRRKNLTLPSRPLPMPISVTTTIISAPTPTARIPRSPFQTSRWTTSSA